MLTSSYQTFIDAQSNYHAGSLPERTLATFVSCSLEVKKDNKIQFDELNFTGIFCVLEVNEMINDEFYSIQEAICDPRIKAIRLSFDALKSEQLSLSALLQLIEVRNVPIEIEYNDLLNTELAILISRWPKINFVMSFPTYSGKSSLVEFSQHSLFLDKLKSSQNLYIKIPEVKDSLLSSATQLFTLYASMLVNMFRSEKCMFASYGSYQTPTSNKHWKALRQLLPVQQFQNLKWKTANKVYGLGIPCKYS